MRATMRQDGSPLRRGRRAAGALLVLPLLAPTLATGDGSAPAPATVPPAPAEAVCRAVGARPPGAGGAWPSSESTPTTVEMTSTRRAAGARGQYLLRFHDSPYGVAVTPDGSFRYEVEVRVEGLRERAGRSFVVWAATPDLDRHERLGTIENGTPLEGTVRWNKFMIFVTAESSPDVESWSQEILLTARSPSGMMHTMAGHGPFSGEPCLDPRN